MCIKIVYKPGCDVINFAIKAVKKTKISSKRKELLRWNKKHFSSFLKGFQSSKSESDLGT